MKTHHPKLKNPPRPLFSCGIFGHCTRSVLSPTTPQTPHVLPSESEPPPPPQTEPAPPRPDPQQPSSSSSSSSTSQSFTQWRFPIPHQPDTLPETAPESEPPPEPRLPSSTNLAEIFHVAELQLSSSPEDKISALHLLERFLVPDPLQEGVAYGVCPPAVMAGVVGFLRDESVAKPATKVLLALCLSEKNRRVAVENGAVAAVLEAIGTIEGAAAERALAALELLCTVQEGAMEVRAHDLAVPMLIEMVGKMNVRGKECAISVLAAIFSGGDVPPTVAQAVVLALQGACSARGRRKGTQLLQVLQDNGRLDLDEDGR